MTKRIKPNATVISNMDQAKAALAELAALDRDLRRIEDDMNETMDTVKANADADAAKSKIRKAELTSALQGFAELNKSELFAKKKSMELPHGVLGFRKSTKLLAAAKVKMGQVLEKLKEFDFREAVKTTETVNKSAMADWPESRLEQVGMRRVEEDVFFIEVKTEDVENAA